ncbi:MAG: hypothetical protein AABW59_02295 [archaeon]
MIQKEPGFRVVPGKKNSVDKMVFDVWITFGSRADPFFFTSPLAREAIQNFPKHSPLQSTNIGEVSYSLLSEEYADEVYGKRGSKFRQDFREKHGLGDKPAYIYEFFPYNSPLARLSPTAANKERSYFRKRGIALNVERIALRELLKVSPRAMLVPSLYMTGPRVKQLRRRGMDITGSNQILSARNVLEVLNKHKKEYKVEHRIPTPKKRMAFALKAKMKLRRKR